MNSPERFASRWGLVLATMGMAVGTGNIWRFPRIAATHGGGSFLIAWVFFLILWSVPLMILELSFGKRARLGTVGAFTTLAGKRFAWMGAWVALCATAIMFYYSVVAGWCLRFLLASLRGRLFEDPAAFWSAYSGSGQAVLTHVIALGLGVGVVSFGIRGIERVAKVLIPLLFVLVVLLALRAITLPGAEAGLAFLFTPDWELLTRDATVWLQALTQNAWDTGAGWGLILTYAVYMRAREDIPLNAFLIGFGNNSISLLAGITVLCTVFALNPGARAEIVGAGNEGLTFVWMPQLFALMPAGRLFMILFFLALSVAALTSLISMLELATRVLMDAGWPRRRALFSIAGAAVVLGTPSALSTEVFANQDWVWGIGLMLSGLFFALAGLRYGLERLRRDVVNDEGADLYIGRWWVVLIGFLVPIEAVILLIWWLRDAYQADPEGWLAPFAPYNVGSVLLQWAIALAVLWAMNAFLVRRSGSGETTS